MVNCQINEHQEHTPETERKGRKGGEKKMQCIFSMSFEQHWMHALATQINCLLSIMQGILNSFEILLRSLCFFGHEPETHYRRFDEQTTHTNIYRCRQQQQRRRRNDNRVKLQFLCKNGNDDGKYRKSVQSKCIFKLKKIMQHKMRISRERNKNEIYKKKTRSALIALCDCVSFVMMLTFYVRCCSLGMIYRFVCPIQFAAIERAFPNNMSIHRRKEEEKWANRCETHPITNHFNRFATPVCCTVRYIVRSFWIGQYAPSAVSRH